MDFSGNMYEKTMNLYSKGVCFPLTQRDAEGRRIILTRLSFLNPDEFSGDEVMRLMAFVVFVLLEEEETQIAGISFISDISNTTARHLITPAMAINIVGLMIKSLPVRFEDIFYVSMPGFAKFLLNIFSSNIKEKLGSLIFVVESKDDLKIHIDAKILPKEYGGVESCDEMKENFKKVIEERKEKVLGSLTEGVDWSNVPEEKLIDGEKEELSGSFRKLEID